MEGISLEKLEGHLPNGIPPFDGDNCAYWRNIMEIYLKIFGLDIWLSFFIVYKAPKIAPTNTDHNKLMICNSKKRHVILSGLTPIVSSNVMACTTVMA
jgi:hypothetical protein